MSTLLAVDDSNTMRKVLEITFAGEDDLEVVLAASANEALGLLNDQEPELALVDVTLGDTDGYSLCQQLKREAPTTRVLLLSSKQNPYDPARGDAVGADDHVDKPFDTQALLDRVRALLERAPLQVAAQAATSPQAAVMAQPAQPASAPPSAPPAVVAAPELELEPEPEPYSPPEPPRRGEPISTAPSAEALEASTVRPEDDAEPPPPKAPSAPPAPSPAAAVAVAASSNGASELSGRLEGLGLTPEQVSSVLALSREVIEQAVWEVVPALAEALIKEEIARLTRE